MAKVEGDIRSKRLVVHVREGSAEEDVVRMMKQIGYPVEG